MSEGRDSNGHFAKGNKFGEGYGAPTKYRPEFCDVVLAIGEEGGWKVEMAEACDVHRDTIEDWAKRHPEFAAALKRAEQKAQAFMERDGRLNLKTRDYNSPQWKHMMAARHPEDYSDRKKFDAPAMDRMAAALEKFAKDQEA